MPRLKEKVLSYREHLNIKKSVVKPGGLLAFSSPKAPHTQFYILFVISLSPSIKRENVGRLFFQSICNLSNHFCTHFFSFVLYWIYFHSLLLQIISCHNFTKAVYSFSRKYCIFFPPAVSYFPP